VTFVQARSSFTGIDDWVPDLLPRRDAAVEVGDVGVSELPEQLGGECGSSSRRAIHNGAPLWIELRAVVGAGWVRPELEHPAGRVDGSADHAFGVQLCWLAHVDEQGVTPDLDRYLIRRQILDL